MTPKDRDNKLQKSRVIYKFKCLYINCPKEYFRECNRTFGDRLKEHLRASSPTMYFHVNDPSLNRNLGKYQLPHIRDQDLQDTPALQLK